MSDERHTSAAGSSREPGKKPEPPPPSPAELARRHDLLRFVVIVICLVGGAFMLSVMSSRTGCWSKKAPGKAFEQPANHQIGY